MNWIYLLLTKTGGAIYLDDKSKIVELTQCEAIGNSAEKGGFIYSDDSSINKIRYLLMANNSASLSKKIYISITK